MQPMKHKLIIGRSTVGSGRGMARAFRLLYENVDRLLEVGTARIEREDGFVICRVNLDYGVAPTIGEKQ